MRLWSIHPKYLDAKGLVALWREGLLAQKVLCKETKGYRRHPQLIRFKNTAHACAALSRYLEYVAEEADRRGYRFNREKILPHEACGTVTVTKGQLEYEFRHLLEKLKVRDRKLYVLLKTVGRIEPHPMFETVEGGIESWEVVDPTLR